MDVTEEDGTMIDERVPERGTVPPALLEKDRWVCLRAVEKEYNTGDDTESGTFLHAVDPTTDERASFDDTSTWGGFDEAYATATSPEADVDGIAFYPTHEGPFTSVELASCRDPETGALDDWAQVVVDTLDSYTEVGVGGQSVRIIVVGKPPDWTSGSISIYDADFFVPLTGDRLLSTPSTIAERTAALRAVYKAWEPIDEPDEAAETLSHVDIASFGGFPPGPVVEVGLSDTALLERARHGPAGHIFRRLWEGGTAGYLTYEEADLGLCCQLAYWTGGDGERMDRLVRKSGRNRRQWAVIGPNDDKLYGERTIERALELTDDYYDPRNEI